MSLLNAKEFCFSGRFHSAMILFLAMIALHDVPTSWAWSPVQKFSSSREHTKVLLRSSSSRIYQQSSSSSSMDTDESCPFETTTSQLKQTTTIASTTRRNFFSRGRCLIIPSLFFWTLPIKAAQAKCTDIDSCREIGERKEQEYLAANPIVRLGSGLQYKVLNTGVGPETVPDVAAAAAGRKVAIAYTISQANGSYMYSRGFGYNKVDILGNGQLAQDTSSVDSLLITLGSKEVPVGIQRAIGGMQRGEKRRIECPPSLGFETSDWNPQPADFRGRQQIKDYQGKLFGRGDTQPPFPSPTVWDVEIVKIY
eukprot:CAMPEP_0198138444 /NCGR_PEP_ID=MMETSP1443-20131203/1866_1 /TAXON_ID=186043 /ORGANISM="Entomoneis sp., Strain CCMP2396" /LENGTH=309 /DNA_ID=CAMNT_0043800231 /DNA_START=17 /DNA_END=943 /DNA_ORIENTATION=-